MHVIYMCIILGKLGEPKGFKVMVRSMYLKGNENNYSTE